MTGPWSTWYLAHNTTDAVSTVTPWSGCQRDDAKVILLVEPKLVPAVSEALGVTDVACGQMQCRGFTAGREQRLCMTAWRCIDRQQYCMSEPGLRIRGVRTLPLCTARL